MADPVHSSIGRVEAGRTLTRKDGADPRRRSPLIRMLRLLGAVLPGDFIRTTVYLYLIDAPRRWAREVLFAFYRFDHVYAVLREFTRTYRGRFSVLEFGTSDGYSFVKLLYATRYLGVEDRVVVHGFDSFEGMPPPADEKDEDLIARDNWIPGQYRGRFEALSSFCSKRYANFRLHKGYFEDTIDSAFLDSLRKAPPILVWIDCDYYSSARTVFERLLPYLPNGCVIYFDELDSLNFGSHLTGEARLVHEVNLGRYGDHIELVRDPGLSLLSRRIYRLVKFPPNHTFVRVQSKYTRHQVRHHGGGSPLP